MATSLKFTYKGSRRYVHGSDMVNAINHSLPSSESNPLRSLTFRSIIRQQCLLCLDPPLADAKIVAVGKYISKKIISDLWVIETSEPVVKSRPFNEEALVALANISGNNIRLNHQTAYTMIENIIALTKQINYHVSPEVDGKWMFGQLSLNCALPEKYEEIIIRRVSGIANKFSSNSINIDGQAIGEIRFIVGKP